MNYDINRTINDFFDVIYDSMKKLHYCYHKNDRPDAFSLFKETCNNIIAGDVLTDVLEEDKKELLQIYSKIFNANFFPEAIRKAMQLIYLKIAPELGFDKNTITPENIGLISAYLISRLMKNRSKIKILDPFVGTGNYLFAIYNHINLEAKLFGADNDFKILEYAKILSDLLDEEIELFFNDAINLPDAIFDIITFDSFIPTDKENYSLYNYLIKFFNMLSDDGYLIAILPDDFFEYDKDKSFRNKVIELGINVIGVIEAPLNFFVKDRKSFYIFSKVKTKNNQKLLSKLPPLDKQKDFQEEISRIENWFKINLDLKDIDILQEDI